MSRTRYPPAMSTLPGEDTTVVVPVVILFGIRRGVVSSSPWGTRLERRKGTKTKTGSDDGRWMFHVTAYFVSSRTAFQSGACRRVKTRWQGFYHPSSPFHHVLGVNVGKRQPGSHVNDFREKIKAIQDV